MGFGVKKCGLVFVWRGTEWRPCHVWGAKPPGVVGDLAISWNWQAHHEYFPGAVSQTTHSGIQHWHVRVIEHWLQKKVPWVWYPLCPGPTTFAAHLVSSPSKSSSLWPSSSRHPGCHSRGPRRRSRRGGGGAGGGGCGARVRKRHILWRAQYRDAKEPCCQNTTICNCFHVSCGDLVVECWFLNAFAPLPVANRFATFFSAAFCKVLSQFTILFARCEKYAAKPQLPLHFEAQYAGMMRIKCH